MSQEKISCVKRISHIYSFLAPSPPRKSPVSCLMRKSHDPRENLMSFPYRAPPNEKISCLLSHEKISCPKRKSHVFSVLAPPQMRKYPVSCLMRISHVTRENVISYQFWVPPMRKSLVFCLMRKTHVSRENVSFLLFSNSITLCLLTS